jgi:hypothetical protein
MKCSFYLNLVYFIMLVALATSHLMMPAAQHYLTTTTYAFGVSEGLEEVAVQAGHKVLLEVYNMSVVIVGDSLGI